MEPPKKKNSHRHYRAMLGTSERATSFTLSLLSTRKLLRVVHDIKKSGGLVKILAD